MQRVFIVSPWAMERAALRFLLPELHTEIVGEAGDWRSTLRAASQAEPDVVVVDWNVMLAAKETAFHGLRQACPAAQVVVLMSLLDTRQHGALHAGADMLICKDDPPDCVVANLHRAMASDQAGVCRNA